MKISTLKKLIKEVVKEINEKKMGGEQPSNKKSRNTQKRALRAFKNGFTRRQLTEATIHENRKSLAERGLNRYGFPVHGMENAHGLD